MGAMRVPSAQDCLVGIGSSLRTYGHIVSILTGIGLAAMVLSPSLRTPSPPPALPPADPPPQWKASVFGLGERQGSPCTGSQAGGC